MAYEIDFIGVGEEAKKDADAIAIRWKDNDGNFRVGVYDGGLQVHGEKLVEFLNQYYFENCKNACIDFVVCSHSDLDHVSGLKSILENFKVKALYMNRPWEFAKDIMDDVNINLTDGRITENSLQDRLRDKYQYICELEEIANEKEVPIYDAFQGDVIEQKFTVLSPTKDFYLQLLVESEKTPIEGNDTENIVAESFIKRAFSYVMSLLETWKKEELKEDVSTSAENEMSVVLLGEMDEENFLLTGDAGIRALDSSIQFSDASNVSLKDTVKFFQIPHHGGRHNVSPSILNALIGNIIDEETNPTKSAFVSVAKDSEHPLQMVVNAFTRRGVKVYKTDGNVIHHHRNMPDRDGWTSLAKLEFDKNVEEWS